MTEQLRGSETIATYIAIRKEWLGDAVEASGDDRTIDPALFFPSPTTTRDDAPAFETTPEQETSLREIAQRFGWGGETDVPAGTDHQIIEGGKVWKAEAETALAGGQLYFSGEIRRKLGEDEKDYLRNKYGLPDDKLPANEYQAMRFVATRQDGFEPLVQEVTLPFGYAVAPGNPALHQPTGQLVRIGQVNGRAVHLLRIDSEPYTEPETGKAKFRYRPDSTAVMRLVSEFLEVEGDSTSSIGMVTSGTYPSRAVDAMRAGLRLPHRRFSVGMYGRATLARVKNETTAEPPALNQLPGELHTIAVKLAALETELNQQA